MFYLLLTITPEQFQTDGLKWVGSIAEVLTGAAIAAALLLPRLIRLRADVESLFRSDDRRKQDIMSTQAQITQVALAVPGKITPELLDPQKPQSKD